MDEIRADEVLTEPEAGELVGLSAATLRLYRRKGIGPRFLKYSQAVRYRRSDVLNWMGEHMVDRATVDDVRRVKKDLRHEP